MTSIALFRKDKEKKNISHIWDAFTHEFKVSCVDSMKLPAGPTGPPSEQDISAAQLVSILKKEQSRRRYGYGTSLWNSMRSHLYMLNPNRSIKAYARQIQQIRHRLESIDADISACWCPLKSSKSDVPPGRNTNSEASAVLRARAFPRGFCC